MFSGSMRMSNQGLIDDEGYTLYGIQEVEKLLGLSPDRGQEERSRWYFGDRETEDMLRNEKAAMLVGTIDATGKMIFSGDVYVHHL